MHSINIISLVRAATLLRLSCHALPSNYIIKHTYPEFVCSSNVYLSISPSITSSSAVGSFGQVDGQPALPLPFPAAAALLY